MKEDFARAAVLNDCPFSDSELELLDKAYEMYSSLCTAYEKVIELEDDPVRKVQLQVLLGLCAEDNK